MRHIILLKVIWDLSIHFDQCNQTLFWMSLIGFATHNVLIRDDLNILQNVL
jgi:hypothetical protein